VAVDVGAEAAPVNAALLDVTARMLATLPEARLACLNVLKSSAMAIDTTLDKEGHNKQIDRLVRLKAWAAPLKLDERRLTAHVLEGTDPAGSILDFVTANRVDHVLIGARQDSLMRRVLGSVSAKVATEAMCSVTIVRAPRPPDGKA
jgi:nucleotide-binding universal stress UspA family protein